MESHSARLAREPLFAKARAFQRSQSFTKITADRIGCASVKSVAALQRTDRNRVDELIANRKHFDQTANTDFERIKRDCEWTFDSGH
jgi:hypothetical protein